jgi:hypothetical protein
MGTGDNEGLPHLGFQVVHFLGHDNQSILVKQERSKPQALNMVPHYFPRGFSKTTVYQRRGWIFTNKVLWYQLSDSPDSNLRDVFMTQSTPNGGTL